MSVAQRSLAENLIKQPFADMDLPESTLRWTRDFEIHNMFAVLVKWSKNKRTATLEHIDVANLRTNENTTEFYYTRKWYVMKNGKRYGKEVLDAVGEPENPGGTDKLLNKFRDCSEGVLDATQIETIIDTILQLENVDSLTQVTRLLTKRKTG